ncbi:MAG TPA: MBOAT family O-acyltransferase [Saprospiraceae bacterium]|nr:MBOAT family O-acyltransferase [Saprospiraceae bacterium]
MQGINWQEAAMLFEYLPERPMLFNSSVFLLFFILFYGGYLLLLRRINLRILYTLAFSIFFYYKSSGVYFVLLLLSTLIDFGLGHYIYHAANQTKRRLFLILSLATNLGMLLYFKYTNFLISSWNEILGSNFALTDIFLPVGISFFTFQTLSYSIDVYRGSLVPVTEGVKDVKSFFRKLMDFAFFVSFFPQLVAGPIVRAADFLPQIRKRPALNNEQLSQALFLIMGGLFKKAVISDYISVNFVDRVFENPAVYSGFDNLLATYGYAIQIYCDFSGYSDMAIGLALLMGFHLPENFRRPYQAISLQDFWRRWHISLSTWLRDYLYISLGGNRRGRFRTYLNLMITMLLGGLWHGASWVYIIWGGLHGLGLTIERFLHRYGRIFRETALSSYLLLFLVHLCLYGGLYYRYSTGLLEQEIYLRYFTGNTVILLIWTVLLSLAYLIDILSGPLLYFAVGRRVSRIFIFHFICLAWIFFRAGAIGASLPPLETTVSVLSQIAGNFRVNLILPFLEAYPVVCGLILLGFVLHLLPQRLYLDMEARFTRSPLFVKSLSLALVIWLVIQTASSEVVPFIYFQF